MRNQARIRRTLRTHVEHYTRLKLFELMRKLMLKAQSGHRLECGPPQSSRVATGDAFSISDRSLGVAHLVCTFRRGRAGVAAGLPCRGGLGAGERPD